VFHHRHGRPPVEPLEDVLDDPFVDDAVAVEDENGPLDGVAGLLQAWALPNCFVCSTYEIGTSR